MFFLAPAAVEIRDFSKIRYFGDKEGSLLGPGPGYPSLPPFSFMSEVTLRRQKILIGPFDTEVVGIKRIFPRSAIRS